MIRLRDATQGVPAIPARIRQATAHAYPDLLFTEMDGGDFDVQGLHVDALDGYDPNLSESYMQRDRLAHMLYGRPSNGGYPDPPRPQGFRLIERDDDGG